MSRKNKLHSNGKDQDIDFASMIRLAESKINRLTINEESFSLSELYAKTRIPQEKLLYLLEIGILKPVKTVKGKRLVNEFSAQDYRNVLFVKELEPHFTLAQIAGLMRIMRKPSFSTDHLGLRVSIDHYKRFDQTERAQILLVSRLLTVEAALIVGPNALNNALIVVRKTDFHDSKEDKNDTLKWESIKREELEPLLRADNSDKLVKGISTPHGEVLLAFPSQTLIESLENKKIVNVGILDSHAAIRYDVTIGLPEEDSLLIERTKERLKRDSESFQFLVRLLKFMFETALKLNEIVYTINNQRGLDILYVLSEAITHIPDVSWDYCGILAPMKSTLKIIGASCNLPNTFLNETYRIDDAGAVRTLPQWVFKNKESAFIDWLSEDRNQSPLKNIEGVVSAAAVPALVGENILGVVYVANTRYHNETKNYYDHANIKLLKVLGQIVGEIIIRQSCINECVNSILQLAPESPIEPGSSNQLYERVHQIISKISQLPSKVQVGENLSFIVIRVDGVPEISDTRQKIVSWISNKIVEKTIKFLQENLSAEAIAVGDPKIYRLNLDRFVTVISPCKIDTRELTQMLESALGSLLGFGLDSRDIKIHAWSLEFTYSEIKQRLKPIDNNVKEVTEELYARIQSALKVLPNIKQADACLKQGNFNLAFVNYEMAHLIDPKNPYVVRHLAECKINMKQYQDAKKYGEVATNLDKNSSSYKVLANALAEQGNFDEAKQFYEKAIELNPHHSSPYVHYGQALVLEGTANSVALALQQFTIAMNCDRGGPPAMTKYLRLKAEACAQIRDYERAIEFLRQALAFSPSDEQLRWSLKLMESSIKDKKNYNIKEIRQDVSTL